MYHNLSFKIRNSVSTIDQVIKGLGSGISESGKRKAVEYAQLVVKEYSRTHNWQQAFDKIMTEKQISKTQKAFRDAIILAVKNLSPVGGASPTPSAPAHSAPVPSAPSRKNDEIDEAFKEIEDKKNRAIPIR